MFDTLTLQACPAGELVIAPLPGEAVVDVSLVLPTYNEGKNITAVVEQLMAVLESVEGMEYEVIVVDDDSPDKTWETALSLTERYPQLRVVRRQGERGLSTAVIRGWQIARGKILAVMDADLQHPPEVAAKLSREMLRGADMGIASRHVEGGGVSDWALGRRIISRGAQLIGFCLLPEVIGRISDPMSGFFMIRRDSIEGRELSPLGYKILIEVLGRGNVKWIAEVPYTFRERVEGSSKLTNKIYIEYFQHLFRLRLYLLHASSFVRFCVVGASGVVIDMSMLYLLSDPSTLHWGLTRSKFLAAEAALLNNFIWNDMWTFGDISREQKTMGQRVKRFLKFNAICSIGIILNILILNVEFNFFHMDRYVANLIAIGLVTLWNYKSNKEFSWRVTAKA
ncbi:MAG: glycosyltransferase [Acidobacteria bacterium]|nr:glycosyltransferase [Acidobacteriota bacterium]